MTVDPAAFDVGTPVHVNFTKWDGRQHWQSFGRLLGVDEYGVWAGFASGAQFYRPGKHVAAGRAHTLLFPVDQGWVGRLYGGAPPGLIRYYVDLSTVPRWSRTATGLEVSMVDLDLDVVEREGQPPYIDDEDEFALHQEAFGYPPDVVATTRSTADDLLVRVTRAKPPFEEKLVRRWVERLDGLS